MTYCVAMKVNDGLVMIADTRTNAGLDNIATFRKLHVFEKPQEYVIGLATAGNLSLSQFVLSHLVDGLVNEETDEVEKLVEAKDMFTAVEMVGRAIRLVYKTHGKSLEEHGAKFDISILLGGQIGNDKMRLFMVYAAGNAIEATKDTPYLQIGEHKYGKPILDRSVLHGTDLYDALKLGLISMDSTMRSNLGVGLPIDVLVLRDKALKPELNFRIEIGESYFHDLRERWSSALRAAHMAIPRPSWPVSS